MGRRHGHELMYAELIAGYRTLGLWPTRLDDRPQNERVYGHVLTKVLSSGGR